MQIETEQTPQPKQDTSSWFKHSPMVKVGLIGILILLLLIPSAWVTSLIEERQTRAQEAIQEVSEKWSGEQYLTGPILVLPYNKYIVTEVIDTNKKVQKKVEVITKEAFFLPHQLQINGALKPENRNRGIFDIVVYHSNMHMKGYFEKPNVTALGIKEEEVLWSKAYLVNGVSDLRGLGENPVVVFNNKNYPSEPTNLIENNVLLEKNFASFVDVTATDSLLHFEISFPLKGSSKLFLYPMGKSTQVLLSGTWSDPKFDGNYLPENSMVGDTFSANWKILSFNRSFPQQWIKQPADILSTAFGVVLLMPVDQYQKSIRTAKYGILIILLTFASLFLIELLVKKSIHPFQYILIGAALIIYYTLLISVSEHLGFNLAYLISSVTIIALISLYSVSIFHNNKISLLLTALLTAFYSYIFIITQQQDFALLLGSVALLIIIATLMFVSRKIDWYNTTTLNSAKTN